jgi:exo-1,4-beta-D-glucosaminidase
VIPDPYYGLNLKSIPGYQEGRWLAMSPDSPFYPSWWWRVEFTPLSDFTGRHITLHIDGINYRANVWLNGKKIASEKEVIGMFRRFDFPVTGNIRFGEKNALAIEIIAPGKLPQREYSTKQLEATTGWDDHNPQPPDLNLGVWQDVRLTSSGRIRIIHPYVRTDLETPSLKCARLTVMAYLKNDSERGTSAEVEARIENTRILSTVTLLPGETRLVKFSSGQFPELVINNPRVWWPNPVGRQEMYTLELTAKVNGETSDVASSRFGIRKAETYINEEGWRGYRINGRNILIRGGAWMTPDMMLALTPKRYLALIKYAREANLNMLRLEGFSIRETDDFYDIADDLGVMVTQQIFGRSIPDEDLAVACIRDMMLRIRNHPSLVHFLGHDETFPTDSLDLAYRNLIEELEIDRSYQPHSGAFNVWERWNTGGTRTGTLELWQYAGPAHYYTHKWDGAWGFAQSGGIGGVAASEESIRRMLPTEKLWPLWTDAFSFHTVTQGGTYFNCLIDAMRKRYGKPADFADFVRTAHVMNYESARGMFEAYGRNKYSATGITAWKYNAAWPAAMTWQYIDWFLLPTGAYHGAKKANEELHVQYSYDDYSVWVVNSLYQAFSGLRVKAAVYNLDMSRMLEQEAAVDVGEDGKTCAFIIKWPKGLTKTYFLDLRLYDRNGSLITTNFYWLSTKCDRPGFKIDGVLPITPTFYPDLSGLRRLDPVELSVESRLEEGGLSADSRRVVVRLKNPSQSLAFFTQAALTKGRGGLEVAPSFWSENDFALLPGEERRVYVDFYEEDLEGRNPVIRVGGWNIIKSESPLLTAEP